MKSDFSYTQKNKIMIASSNVLFRRGLRALLAGEPGLEAVDEIAAIDAILDRVSREQVRVLVIGCEQLASDTAFAHRVHLTNPDLAIIALTDEAAHDSSSIEAVRRLPRSTSASDLLRHIRAAATGQIATSTSANDLRALSEANRKQTRPDALTQREKEVIRLLAEGMTVREAALELRLSAKTVEAHTLNLMRKLAIHDRASLIGYAVSSGMVEAPAHA